MGKKAVPRSLDASDDDSSSFQVQTSALERLARGVAFLVVRGEKQEGQIAMLDAIGFSSAEIGKMLGTTPATVRQTLYLKRKRRTKP